MLYEKTYFFYFATILSSTFFAWLADKFAIKKNNKKKLNSFFWSLSFLSLWFTMGFRLEVGVDYYSYRKIYETVSGLGFFGFYDAGFVIEPLYVLLLYLADVIYGDFTGVFIASSFIGLFLLYKAFALEAKKINPTYSVFIFSTTQYFYYFGIDRLFLAAAVYIYGYRFIIRQENHKYYITVLIAALFHYSALLLLIVPYICYQVDKRITEYRTVKVFGVKKAIIFVVLLSLVIYIFPLIKPYLAGRYQGYGMIEDPLANLLSVVTKLPIVGIVIFMRIARSRIFSESMVFYANLYIASIFIQIFLGFLGLGRFGWYFWFPLCFLLPLMMETSKDLLGKYAILTFIACFSIGYLFYAYLGVDSGRYAVMFPYRNLFFEL